MQPLEDLRRRIPYPSLTRGRVALSLVLCLGAAVALAACGGAASTDTASANNPASSTAAPAGGPGTTAAGADRQAFRDCVQQHGVDTSTLGTAPPGSRPRGTGGANGATPGSGRGAGGFGGLNTDDPKVQDAMSACRNLLPNGGFGGPNGTGPGRQAAQAYQSCLQSHGVTVPTDPNGGRTRGTMDRNDPKVSAAMNACRALLPNGSGTGNGGSPTTSSTTATDPGANG